MCGRFSLTVQEDEIERLFNLEIDRQMYIPRYNGAPTQMMPVITGEGKRAFRYMRWGLVPFWAKDPSIGSKLINARSETILEKPAFRQAFRQRRCLVPADGFFEWKKNGKKIPYRFVMHNKGLFAMAGIWEKWTDVEGKDLMSFCILTTAPNEILAKIHDRMPVIVPPTHYDEYLFSSNHEELSEMLIPYPSEKMSFYQVSELVNSAKNNDPRVIAAIEPKASGLF